MLSASHSFGILRSSYAAHSYLRRITINATNITYSSKGRTHGTEDQNDRVKRYKTQDVDELKRRNQVLGKMQSVTEEAVRLATEVQNSPAAKTNKRHVKMENVHDIDMVKTQKSLNIAQNSEEHKRLTPDIPAPEKQNEDLRNAVLRQMQPTKEGAEKETIAQELLQKSKIGVEETTIDPTQTPQISDILGGRQCTKGCAGAPLVDAPSGGDGSGASSASSAPPTTPPQAKEALKPPLLSDMDRMPELVPWHERYNEGTQRLHLGVGLIFAAVSTFAMCAIIKKHILP